MLGAAKGLRSRGFLFPCRALGKRFDEIFFFLVYMYVGCDFDSRTRKNRIRKEPCSLERGVGGNMML